ncbi:AraC family transcriptional regulator [Vibrio profundum]|uniref:helix-turn-helix transcriptional regulator n=1 Tax=Vibrio profundum TaxID=2910247 RepID=UPI003D14E566
MNIKLTRFSPNRSIQVHHLKHRSPIFEFHAHDSYELIMLKNCNGKRYIGDSVEEVSSNELVLIPPFVPHTWDSKYVAEDIVVVLFGRELLDLTIPEFQPLTRWLKTLKQPISLDLEVSHTNDHYIQTLLTMKKLAPIERVTAVLNLLSSLSHDNYQAEHGDMTYPSAKLSELVAYMSGEKVRSLAECAVALNMSESTLKRWLKKELDTNFTDFYRHIRISKAQKLLASTSTPIPIIAEKSSFNSTRSFNAAFKAYSSLTPKQFRAVYHWRFNQKSSVASA